jgi:hypothetical protein
MKRGDALPGELRGIFAEFWEAYPHRRPNPRAVAEGAFAAAVKAGAKPADLVGAAAAYAAECRAKGIAEAFIVHARTFLAQRRFEDYLGAVPAPAAASSSPAEPDHPWWPAFRGRVSPAAFAHWIVPLACMGGSTDADGRALSVTLSAPSAFHRDYVREHFAEALKAALGCPRIYWEGAR